MHGSKGMLLAMRDTTETTQEAGFHISRFVKVPALGSELPQFESKNCLRRPEFVLECVASNSSIFYPVSLGIVWRSSVRRPR